VVVVDVEEEFDWSRGFSRENTAVASLAAIGRVQRIFDDYAIIPVYAVDYPVASQPQAHGELKRIHDSGRCIIGAHLHPWVNPPFAERIDSHNSFPGNLPRSLEARKLELLTDCITRHFGARPTVYKAGRYGVGTNSASILQELEYEVDLSVCPHMNYAAEGGPDFSRLNAWPCWFGEGLRLLELPLTIGYAGLLRRHGPIIHGLAARPLGCRAHLPGLLARLGLLDKIWLSPEGFTSCEHRKLTLALYKAGLRIFSFAFHSPSVEPGHTPYVRSARDLEGFLESCRSFFEFFLGVMNGRPATPGELKRQLGRESGEATAEETASPTAEVSRMR
jgi:hypothetical protein